MLWMMERNDTSQRKVMPFYTCGYKANSFIKGCLFFDSQQYLLPFSLPAD